MYYGGTAHPPATERAGPDKPPPTVARASALPDNFREGSWKRGLWWNCAPTRNRKGGTGQASTYGCARQCPTPTSGIRHRRFSASSDITAPSATGHPVSVTTPQQKLLIPATIKGKQTNRRYRISSQHSGQVRQAARAPPSRCMRFTLGAEPPLLPGRVHPGPVLMPAAGHVVPIAGRADLDITGFARTVKHLQILSGQDANKRLGALDRSGAASEAKDAGETYSR